MTKIEPRPITSVEQVYDFLQDANDQRRREIQMQDLSEYVQRTSSLIY